MRYDFFTDDEKRARAALILYALYRSRSKSSSLNGIETWNRFTAYVRGAVLKSTNTAEFVNQFCKMAKVDSIRPKYLKESSGYVIQPDGSIIVSDDVKDFKINIIEDDSLMNVFENESVLLSMLVRERIQREKTEGTDDEDED